MILQELKYITYMGITGIPVPEIYLTKTGELFHTLETKDHINYVALMEFIEGEHELYTKAAIRKVAKLQADFHFQSQLYSPDNFVSEEDEYSAMSYRMKEKDIQKTERFPDRLYLEMNNIYQIISRKLKTYYEKQKKLIIHSDLKMDNLLFCDDDIRAVLDFGDIRKSVIAEDLGVFIWDMCDELFDAKEDFSSYLSEYFSAYREKNKDFSLEDELFAVYYAIDRYLIINLYYLNHNQYCEEKLKYQENKAEKQLKIIYKLLELYPLKSR